MGHKTALWITAALFWAATTTTAWAVDPFTVIAAFSLFATPEIGVAIAFAANVAIAAGISYAAQALLGKKPLGGGGFNTPETRYSTRQTVPAKREIYGKALVGGALFFEKATAPYLVQGFLIKDGIGTSVEAIYVGNNKLAFPGGITPGTILTPGSVTGQPDYANNLRCSIRLGDDNQTIDPLILSRFPDEDSNFRQRGVMTIVFEFKHPADFNEYQALWGNSQSPSVLMVVNGTPYIFDPRDPTQDIADKTTWKFSDNATLIQTSYLIDQRGGRINPNRVVWDRIVESANYDDSLMGTKEGELLKIHTLNALVQMSQRPAEVMSGMLSANRGAIVQEGGKVWVDSSQPKEVVLVITDDLIIGGLQFSPYKNRRDLVNIVEPRFIASELDYQEIPGPQYRNEQLIIDYGEEHLSALELPCTLDNRRCQRLAKLFGLEAALESGLSIIVDLLVLERAIGPLANGIMQIDSELFPQCNGLYQIRNYSFAENFAGISISAVKYDSSIETSWDPATDQQDFVEPLPDAA